jgi:hypothetical protein
MECTSDIFNVHNFSGTSEFFVLINFSTDLSVVTLT